MAVSPDRDDEPVREYPSFTVDLNAIADWLKGGGADTVAMESAAVYWIPLFELLESRGFTVRPANAGHVRNVSGRKSDATDCQWPQQIMTYALLSGAFRPAEQICVLRSLWRQRVILLRLQAHEGGPAKGRQRGRARNAPKFDLRTQLFNSCGVDLTRIDGIDVSTALAIISETGTDWIE